MSNVQNSKPNSEYYPSNRTNINNLGYFLDGWADLIEGMSAKAEEVRKKVYDDLIARDMPEISTSITEGYASLSTKDHDRRIYVLSKTYPGASTSLYIGKHGKDLYFPGAHSSRRK